MWPIGVPGPLPVPSREEQQLAAREMGGPDLHSARTVAGYCLAARDGDIGHVEDFLLDSEAWVIRYIIVDARNWLPGKHVLVSPGWIRDVEVGRLPSLRGPQQGRNPELAGVRSQCAGRAEDEGRLFRHHERSPYWSDREAVRPPRIGGSRLA